MNNAATKNENSGRINAIVPIFLIVAAFIVASWLGKQLLDILSADELLLGGWGMPLYVLVTVIAIVIAPISMIPFIPLAVGLWGAVTAALLNIAGWTIGSAIAFLIARIFGHSLVMRLIGAKSINKIERFLPQKHLFWSVVFLRMVLPVDLLSYALGLFTNMRFFSYLLASFIGIVPFSFVFSYAAELPLAYQLIVGAVVIALVVIINVLLIRSTRQTDDATNQISIIMYYWGGKKFGIKIKKPCAECDINHGILDDMKQKEFNGQSVNVVLKPWLTHFWESLVYGGWHAPIIIVNGKLFSQGIIIDRKKLVGFVLADKLN